MLLKQIREVVKAVPDVKHYLSNKTRWILAVKGGEGSGNFGHAGRPGEVGGSAPSGGGKIPSIYKGVKVSIREPLVGFEKSYAYWDADNNEIVFNINRIGDFENNGYSLDAILAHEYTHVQFDKSKIVGAFGLRTGMPIFSAFGASSDRELFEIMARTGSITGYSKLYWEAARQSNTSSAYALAINETLAEISRLQIDAPVALEGGNIDSSWLRLHKFVMDAK